MADNHSDHSPPGVASSLGLVIPGLLVAALYGGFLFWKGVPEGESLRQLDADLKQVRSAEPTWEKVGVLEARDKIIREDRADAAAELGAVKAEADRLTKRPQGPSGASMALLSKLTTILETHGLVTTYEQSYPKEQRPPLFGYVDEGVKALQRVQAEVEPTPESQAPMLVDFVPPGMTIEQAAAAQRAARATGNLPKLSLHEFEVWGSYGKLLDALEDIALHCEESVVLGVDFRRYDEESERPLLRIRITMNFQPASSTITEPTSSDSQNMIASRSARGTSP